LKRRLNHKPEFVGISVSFNFYPAYLTLFGFAYPLATKRITPTLDFVANSERVAIAQFQWFYPAILGLINFQVGEGHFKHGKISGVADHDDSRIILSLFSAIRNFDTLGH
jgi:hypothetical protein